jgi:hypothetical protein
MANASQNAHNKCTQPQVSVNNVQLHVITAQIQ